MTATQAKSRVKIADTNTPMPDSGGKTFADFGPPSFDGTSCVFWGKTSGLHGIYGTLNGGRLMRISDTATTIPDLDGSPSDGINADGYEAHAYVPNPVSNAVFPCTYSLNHSRPALSAEGNVVFFASNRQHQKNGQFEPITGIFVFEQATGQYHTLALNARGYFKDAHIEQPTYSAGGVYFAAVGWSSASHPLAPGVYTVPVVGGLGDASPVLNINTAKMPDGVQITSLGNPHVIPLLPMSSIIAYGEYMNAQTQDSVIFLYARQDQTRTLSRLVKPGDSIGGNVVSKQWNNSELSVGNQLLAFRCPISENNHVLAAIDLAGGAGKPVLITTDFGEIPGGGGTFNGFSFAMPPATDGNHVVFVGGYNDINQNMQTGLFAWNVKTQTGRKLLDSTDVVDGHHVANFNLHTNSVAKGKVAVEIVFQGIEVPCAIYILDLE